MSDRQFVTVPLGPSPSELPVLGAITPLQTETVTPDQPPRNSLLAAAVRLTATSVGKRAKRGANTDDWQEDAWEMYDLVGEVRFITNLLANQMSKARFYVGTISDDPTSPPVPVEDPTLQDALEA